MDYIKKMVITACILCVIITIAECLRPGSGASKQLKTLFSLIFFSGILAAAANSSFDFQLPEYGTEEFENNYDKLEDSIFVSVAEQTGQKLSIMAEELLKKEGIECKKIVCDVNISENGRIDINRISYEGKSFERARRILEKNFSGTEVTEIE